MLDYCTIEESRPLPLPVLRTSETQPQNTREMFDLVLTFMHKSRSALHPELWFMSDAERPYELKAFA